MTYVLIIIAALWMADGVALLVAPDRMMGLMKAAIAASPTVLQWAGLGAVLGVLLLVGTKEFAYQPLWMIVGAGMIVKGSFLVAAPDTWRWAVLDWCFRREPVDYRFWGLGLCVLSVLLLDALDWLNTGDSG